MPEDPFYLIRRSHLPEVMRKTTEVTELLQRHPDLSVLEAVQEVGISRSAYYKYKDAVKPFYSAVHGHIVTIALSLGHERGVLSSVLNFLAQHHANILTINQSLPLQGMATVIVSMETREMEGTLEAALEGLRSLPGVHEVRMTGQG
ncbi:ACT domain-containing protein [Alicyclobacillus tolerans]|uniref:ACT domain-containing protein n=1 Tax=Alicyclobacillus tolerans TaxID=90970 RepID=UPI001F2214E0|nr:ACT domain-containing protein [Alicyclobacillus tolerans]MCF8566156.1 ACT domain-containing protein [Alicyclobacillus tolerans]